MERIFPILKKAALAQNAPETRLQSIELARVVNDLRLQHLPIKDIDQARLDLWLAQIAVDAERKDMGGIRGDIATAALVFERFSHTFEPKLAANVSQKLDEMRIASEEDAADEAVSLASEVRGLLVAGWK